MANVEQEQLDKFAINNGRTFIWHELYAPDIEAAIDFYVRALDFGREDSDMGEMGTYRMLTRNGQAVAGSMSTTANPGMEQVPPHWAVYISVDDVDARLAKCTELGAKLVVPPMDIPGVGRMALISDPQGAHVWLFKSAS